MSKLFCVSPGLRVLERQMQQPPGYRPRGYGICVMDVDWRSRGNYSEIVDCVISRMQMEHLKKRVDEIFCEVDKELIFRNPKHRNDFYSLLMGKRAKTLQYAPGYAAAVFLLSADGILWEKIRKNVLDTGIYFDRVRLLEQCKFLERYDGGGTDGRTGTGNGYLLLKILNPAKEKIKEIEEGESC